jgi:hypothetical protein
LKAGRQRVIAGQVPDRRSGKELKVFWFFSSEKNILSSE